MTTADFDIGPSAFIATSIAFIAGIWLAEISGLPWLLLSIAAVGFGSTYRAPLVSVEQRRKM